MARLFVCFSGEQSLIFGLVFSSLVTPMVEIPPHQFTACSPSTETKTKTKTNPPPIKTGISVESHSEMAGTSKVR